MSSKVQPMDLDSPPPSHMTPTMTYSSMPVLGMTRPKRPIEEKEEMFMLPT